jgi:hypothetical protein
MEEQHDHALARSDWRRHALLLIGILGFVGLFVAVHVLQANGTFATGVPVWVKLSGIVPLLLVIHPVLATLHPALVLLISVGAAIIGFYKRRANTRNSR